MKACRINAGISGDAIADSACCNSLLFRVLRAATEKISQF
jgi:hypothetical protein